MKTLTQYRDDIKNLMKKVTDIDTQCTVENREITEAELALKNEILDTVEDLRKIVLAMDRQERLSAALEAPNHAVTVENKIRPTITVSEKEKFKSLGEQMAAVMTAGRPGGHVDPRLFNAATGLGESVQTSGGFLVQQDFATNMMNEVITSGVLASRCKRIQIGPNSDGIKINGIDESSRASNLWGGIMVYMTDEAGTVTATKPKFRRIELNLHKMMGICYLTDDLMKDSAALEGFVTQGFTSAFRWKLDDQIFQGSGAGECLGLMNAGCLVSVAAESGQKASTIVAENIVNMYSRRFAAQTSNYVWLYNQSIEPQLFTMSLAVGTGGIPIYMPAGGLSDAPYARLMGLPAIAIEHAAALGTAGDIVLANLTDGYILAEKGGIRQDVSIHVQFLYDEQVLRFIARFDGQPWRATSLTPYKGGSGATQSHFIALATRS